jgi:hypothetical protein
MIIPRYVTFECGSDVDIEQLAARLGLQITNQGGREVRQVAWEDEGWTTGFCLSERELGISLRFNGTPDGTEFMGWIIEKVPWMLFWSRYEPLLPTLEYEQFVTQVLESLDDTRSIQWHDPDCPVDKTRQPNKTQQAKPRWR